MLINFLALTFGLFALLINEACGNHLFPINCTSQKECKRKELRALKQINAQFNLDMKISQVTEGNARIFNLTLHGKSSKTKTITGVELIGIPLNLTRPVTKWKLDTDKGVITSTNCDFEGSTFKQVKSRRKGCMQKCLGDKKCTHFAYENGNACSLKSGNETTNNAIASMDNRSGCGIVIDDILQKNLVGQTASSECYDAFVKIALARSNFYRSRHRVLPLRIDSPLATRTAQNWATNLNIRFALEHNPNLSNLNLGENLFAKFNVFKQSQSPQLCEIYAAQAIDAWYSEIRFYDFRNPRFSLATGHFTQLVWKSTRSVGFGLAFSDKPDRNGWYHITVVADYSPPGNVLGQFQNNVFPA